MSRPVDPELLLGFLEEANGYLPSIRAGLAAMRANLAASEAEAEEAHRFIHTIKGAAAMVGLNGLSHIAFHLEDAVEAVIQGVVPADPTNFSKLDAATDALEAYLDGLSKESFAEDAIIAAAVGALDGLLGKPKRPHEERQENSEDAIGGDDLMPPPFGRDTSKNLAAETATDLPSIDEFALPDFRDLAPPPIPATPAIPNVPPPPSVVAETETPAPDVSPELLEVFKLEADDHLRVLTSLLPETRKNPGDKSQWQEIRRAAHTLKGTAAMVGFADVTKLAHRMEDLLDQYFEGTRIATPNEIDTLLSSTDAIEDTINGREVKFAPLFAKLDAALTISDVPAAETAPTVAAEAPAPEVDDEASEKTDAAAPRRDANEAFVRVPIEKLNDIVKLVSELVISRTAFESRLGDFERLLGELDPSTTRLRRASTKLETGFEASALVGGRSASSTNAPTATPVAFGGGGDGFDDLEFDRYTEFHLISRELAETTNDIQTLGGELGYVHGDFDGYLTRQARLSSELEDKLMRLRMVPLSTMASKLSRTVRNAATQTHKKAELVLEGERTGLDKTVLDAMADPLLHLLRNAVDHGLETPEVRRALNKPESGTIRLSAGHEGSQVVLRIRDDGKGIDLDAVRATAVERGIVSAEIAETMPADDVYAMLFAPGFSTKGEVTEMSGRGVGLDVVKTKVESLKGTVSITSAVGEGTTFTIRLPMTLAVTRALMVQCNQQTFAIPLDAVEQIIRLEDADLSRIGTDPILKVGGTVYPVAFLSRVLSLKATSEAAQRPPVLLLKSGEKRMAMVVDSLLGGREIVIKNMGPHLKRVPCVSGATLMGDGTVVLILNPADLIRAASNTLPTAPTKATTTTVRTRVSKTVLVVDDSPSVRRVLTSLMNRQNWTTVTAKDGLEALEILQRGQVSPDIVLSDVEMPRMDGYELLGTIRAQVSLSHLPVVMITSRAAEKHRKKAMELGASAYVTKPYQDESLLAVIRQLTRAGRTE